MNTSSIQQVSIAIDTASKLLNNVTQKDDLLLAHAHSNGYSVLYLHVIPYAEKLEFIHGLSSCWRCELTVCRAFRHHTWHLSYAGIHKYIFFLPMTIETMNKVKILFNCSWPVTTPALTEILHSEKLNVSKTYLNKYNELFVLCNSSNDLDTLFSSDCISELEAVGCKPILPPDLKSKRSLILRRCDDQILNHREEDIKSEIEKQNDSVKVKEIFKYNS